MMKLTYFNVRGLAETSRILLAIGNEEYEDFRYPLEIIDMAAHKMNKPEFENDKKEGKLLNSLNKVPFLTLEDGTIIPQSKTIERFLANRFYLMGSTDVDAARIDAICECVRDFKELYQPVRKLEGEEKEKGLEEWFTKTLVEKLELLEHNLDNDEYSVGYHLSLSDVVLFGFITQFFDNKEAAMKATETTPKIRGIVENVGKLGRVQKWLESRPQTDF